MPPVVIAAGIGAAASVGGGLLSAKAQKKAANRAADTAAQNTAANNALTREIYGQNKTNISPFMNNGLAASNALNGLLGLTAPVAAPPSAPTSGTQRPANALASYMQGAGQAGGPRSLPGWYMEHFGDRLPSRPGSTAPGAPATPAAPAPSPRSAWDTFRNSTNYQFRLGEGLRGLNQGYAAAGLLESGAAMKGINNYAQQFASNELGNYMNLLAGQQNMGLSGANALAGVGTSMVNNVTANNNSAASAAANAALMRGYSQANMFGNIAGALGNFAGSFGSSYGNPFGLSGGQI